MRNIKVGNFASDFNMLQLLYSETGVLIGRDLNKC